MGVDFLRREKSATKDFSEPIHEKKSGLRLRAAKFPNARGWQPASSVSRDPQMVERPVAERGDSQQLLPERWHGCEDGDTLAPQCRGDVLRESGTFDDERRTDEERSRKLIESVNEAEWQET